MKSVAALSIMLCLSSTTLAQTSPLLSLDANARGNWVFDHRTDIDDTTNTWGPLKSTRIIQVQKIKAPNGISYNIATYTAYKGTIHEWDVDVVWNDPPLAMPDNTTFSIPMATYRLSCPTSGPPTGNCSEGFAIGGGIFPEVLRTDGNNGWVAGQYDVDGRLVPPPRTAPGRTDMGWSVAVTDVIQMALGAGTLLAVQLVPKNPAYHEMPSVRYCVTIGDGNGYETLACYFYNWLSN